MKKQTVKEILSVLIGCLIGIILHYTFKNKAVKPIECEYHLIVSMDSIKIINEKGFNKIISRDSPQQIIPIIEKDLEWKY